MKNSLKVGSVLLGFVAFLIGYFGRRKRWATNVDLGGLDFSDLE